MESFRKSVVFYLAVSNHMDISLNLLRELKLERGNSPKQVGTSTLLLLLRSLLYFKDWKLSGVTVSGVTKILVHHHIYLPYNKTYKLDERLLH